ncbi:putative transcription regulator mTERF family [Rosa chinensis]|uniref:Putative transcription regulator mTERF family n=2 Tax=Rosa chinensis TaxID=74649 RepID=A0A2P6SA35_ROSCH|nr:putative transcription regulator mTERF family [Rosa chinensis]
MNALWCRNTFNRNRQVYMMRWGWSEDDFLSAFRKCPRSMVVSEKKLMQVMDFWVNKMGWPSVIIAKYAIVCSYSLQKRIIPRCSVLKVLLSKGLINENLSKPCVLAYAEEQFLEMFVTKFVNQIPQLLSVYQENVDLQDVTS